MKLELQALEAWRYNILVCSYPSNRTMTSTD